MSPAAMTSLWSGLARLALVFAIGGVGGAGFAALGMPAAWLSGAMVAVALAAIGGLTAVVPQRLRDGIFVLLGISMGAGVTPDLVDHVADWPASLAGLVVTVTAMTSASYFWLRRVAGWDAATAYFGAIPGALTMTLATAATSRADLVRVSVSQTLRLLMLVAVLPLVVSSLGGHGAGGGAGVITDLSSLALLLGAGAAGAAIGALLRFPAGILIGAFLASCLMHGFGLVHGQLPMEIQVPALVAVGSFIGLRFAGTGWRLISGTLVAGIGAFLVALAVSTVGALAVAFLFGLPVGQVIVAYAPGGLDVMVVLAFLLKVDPAFVAAHHFVRFLAMSVLVPLLASAVLGRNWSSQTSGQ